MTKDRVQTRKKDAEDGEDGALPLPNGSSPCPQIEGTVDILACVLTTGFFGWYKVCSAHFLDFADGIFDGCQILRAVLS